MNSRGQRGLKKGGLAIPGGAIGTPVKTAGGDRPERIFPRDRLDGWGIFSRVLQVFTAITPIGSECTLPASPDNLLIRRYTHQVKPAPLLHVIAFDGLPFVIRSIDKEGYRVTAPPVDEVRTGDHLVSLCYDLLSAIR